MTLKMADNSYNMNSKDIANDVEKKQNMARLIAENDIYDDYNQPRTVVTGSEDNLRSHTQNSDYDFDY